MIKADINKGEVYCKGAIDDILTEYTITTKMIWNQLEEITDKEKASKALARMGQIAVNDTPETNAQAIYDEIIKVVDDELQI